MNIGAIEAGGTKFVVGVGNENGDILHRERFPTTYPKETLAKVFDFFRDKQIDVLGIGTFGPISIDPKAPDYGTFMLTPKVKWSNFDLLTGIKQELNVPIVLDTDVNAALCGEAYWGAAHDVDSAVYITVGTGIGGGIMAAGNIIHGMVHPEIGHMLVRRHPKDTYQGGCPYHGDCLEGLASGPAIEARWGKKADLALQEDLAFEIQSFYLAQVVTNLRLLLSTKRVILGGGVMKQIKLFPSIRVLVEKMMGNYMMEGSQFPSLDDYVIPPGLGDDAGLKGTIALVLNNEGFSL